MNRSDESRITAKEDRLLKRYRSYRGAYVGASFLSVLHVAMWFSFFLTPEDYTLKHDTQQFAFWSIWFWAAIAAYAGSKLDHIETIRLYRDQRTTDDSV